MDKEDASRKNQWVGDRWSDESKMTLLWKIAFFFVTKSQNWIHKIEFLHARFWIISWKPLKDFFQHSFWKKNFTVFKASLHNKIFLSKDVEKTNILKGLTRWLRTTSILAVIGRIYRYQFKDNYLKNWKGVFNFLLHFWNLH